MGWGARRGTATPRGAPHPWGTPELSEQRCCGVLMTAVSLQLPDAPSSCCCSTRGPWT